MYYMGEGIFGVYDDEMFSGTGSDEVDVLYKSKCLPGVEEFIMNV